MRDFNHTLNVLVTAYFNNTLQHGNCFACAVGNLVACSIGTRVIKRPKESQFYRSYIWEGYDGMNDYPAENELGKIGGWGSVMSTDIGEDGLEQSLNLANYIGKAKEQIDSTGYSVAELARIEYAFELERYKPDEMFNGLMAVVDVLAEIHGIDLSKREEAKLLFVKA